MMTKKRTRSLNAFGLAGLGIYIVFISWRLFFYAYTNNYRKTMDSLSYNLIPFRTIGGFLNSFDSLPFDVWIYNLAGNIAAFLPLGFLLPMAFKELTIKKTVMVSLLLISLAEIMQLLSLRGVFDIDDIILNALGSFLGCILYKLCEASLWKVKKASKHNE